jgi:hypothetical protein
MRTHLVVGPAEDVEAPQSPPAAELFEREGFIVVGRPSEKYVVMQREA